MGDEKDFSTITWELDSVDLTELIMVVGSYIYGGNSLESIDTDVINKLHYLIKEEYEHRQTGIPTNTQLH